MKKMKALAGVGKRLFAAVLTLCLVLTMLPAMELTTAAAATAAPQVSYSIGTAYKYTAGSGSKALPYGTASPSASTAVSSLSGNVLTLGTTASTSSTSTNFKLIYVPVAVTVTVPANTELYLKHNIEAVANRVVGKNTATVTATSAVYYLGQTDASSGLTFYPYYDGGASRDGADARELATAYQGQSSTTQTRFTLDANKTIGYQNDTAQAKEFTDYFGVMIVIQRASSVENTMTAEVTFTAQTLHGHDGAVFDTPWVAEGGAVSGSGNYYLSSDMTATGDISINSGVTAKLCLNGYTLDMGQYSLTNNGTLLICDCGGGGITGTVASTSASPKGTVSNNGTLTMTGGHISNTGDASGQSNFAIVNKGTAAEAAITGGKVTSAGEGIYNYGSSYATTGPSLTLGGTLEVESAYIAVRNAYGTVRVDGGTYTSTNSYGISSTGSESFTAVVTVTGGNITGTTGISNNTYADLTVSGDTTILGTSLYGVSNSSRFTFLGGSITSTGSGSGVDNNSTGKAVFIMKGGSVLSERYRGVNNYGGTVEISGGTVTSTSNNGVHNSTYTSGSTTYLATVTVTGGTITGKRGIYNADSQAVVNMEGGKATGASSQGIYNGGLLYISGSPQITGATADIYKANEAAIYAHSSDGTAAPYTGDKLSIAPNNAQEGDVVVNNITDGNKNKFSVVNEGYTLRQDGDDLLLAVKPSHTHTGVTGEFEEWTAKSGTVSTSGKYYLADNITATGNITIASGAEVTLCLNGHTLDLGSKKITVSSGATLGICDCSEGESGVIKSTHRAALNSSDRYSDTAGAINVFGNATISSGTVQNDCQYGRAIYVGSNANLTISGGKVAITNNGHYAVYVGNNTLFGTDPAGTFTMTGGVIDTGTGYGSGSGVYIRNGAVATVTGGKIQSGGGSQAIQNYDSTLIIGGDAVINSTGEYSAIWLNANGSSATAALHITGGTITAPNAEAAVGIAGGNGETVVYLSGNPTITGKDSDISTYVEMDGTIKPKFYAVSENGNTAYSGEALRLYLDGAHRAQSGEVVVRNSTDTEKFTLTNGGYKLEQSGENLAIATYGYNLWVGGVYVTEDNASDILGNGTASYNAETQTLYLENAVISGSYTPEDLDYAAGIYSSHALNIVISGTVDILVQSSNYGIGILVDGDLNIAKDPDNSSVTLNVIGDFAAAGCLDGGNITYDGLTVKGSAEIDTQNAPTEEVALSDGIFFAGSDIAKMLQFTYTAPHTHIWSEDWASDGTAHWHECESADCTVTENSEKDGYGTHTAPDDDGSCLTGVVCPTCQYVFTAAAEAHEYGPGGKCTNTGCQAIDSEPFDIFVQVEGIYKPYTLSVTHTMTVAQLKAAIASTAALNNAKIASLTYSGTEMKDSELLSAYALQKASTLQAALSHSHDGITYDSPWTASQGVAPGSTNWYLVEDMTASGDITLGNGVDACTVYFCLNGKTLDMGEYRFMIAQKATVHLCDCCSEGKITGDYFYNKYSPINNGGTLTVSGGSYESVTSPINNYGNLEISGGTFINTNNSYAVWHTSGDFYLYGNPTLNGSDSGPDIYMFQKDARIYARKGTAQYTGGTVSIAINKNFVAAGDTVVYGTTDTGRFTAFDTGYKLKTDGTNLILTEVHNHGGVSYNVELAQGAQWSGTVGTDLNMVLTGDSTGADLVIGSGVTVNLCLNGHTLDLGDTYITNNGSLHMCDCAGGGRLLSSNNSKGTVYNSGTLAVSGGTVENSSAGYAVINADSGSIQVSDTGSILGAGAVRNGKGTVEITGGTVTGRTGYGVNGDGAGSITVSGGKVLGGTYGIYYSGTGTVSVSGGTVTGERYYGIYNSRSGSISVSGGTVSGDGGIYSSAGALYISGSPTVTANGTKGGVSLGESGKLYAHAKGDTGLVYTGSGVTVTIPGTFINGVVVYGVNDTTAGKFRLAEGAAQTLVRVGDRLIVDSIAPAGEIVIGTERWSTFTGDISFDLFFTQAQSVSITASDSFGVKEIAYYLAAQEMSKTQLAALAGSAWIAETAFNIEPDNKYVIYAKLTDNAGNVTYINTDGIVLDSTAPILSGIENGKTYCGAVEVAVSEAYLDKVTVDAAEAALTGGKLTVNPASGAQEIKVTDKAGNTTTYTVTVNAGHTYTYGESTEDTVVEKCEHCDFSAAAQIKKPEGQLVYNGSAHDATVVYTGTLSGGNTLAVSYGTAANTVAAGSYTASITFGGVTASVSYTVGKASFTAQVEQVGTLVYNSAQQKAAVKTTETGVAGGQPVTYQYGLTENACTSAAVPAFKDAGSYTVYFVAAAPNHENAKGSFTVTVQPKTLTVSDFAQEGGQLQKVYDGTTAGPGGNILVLAVKGLEGADLSPQVTVLSAVFDSPDAGSRTLHISIAGNSGGNYVWSDSTVQASAQILPKAVTEPQVLLSAQSLVYTGAELKPAVVVRDGEMEIPSSEYVVVYTDNIAAGTATVTVTNRQGGNYTISAAANFTVLKADPDITWPENLSGREHSCLSTVTLPGGFTWDDPTAAIGYGENSYPMTYTPADTDNYNVLHSNVPLAGLDEVAPVISSIENGAVIYGDGVFTVTDDHLASVTVDGTPLTAGEDGKYTVPADNGEHTVEAADESGNRTAYTLKIYKIYTVVLKADGKTVSTQQVGYGKDAALYAIPAKAGHDQTAPYWDHSGKNITADRVITAVYTPNTYTVTYIADGEVVETVKVTYGGSATAPAIPEKEGYTQTAPVWDAEANGVTEDMTVTAQYTVNKYTVTYRDENGVYRTLTYSHGEKVELLPPPAKEGYTVTWDTTVDEITGDVTVNAVYTPVAPVPTPEADGQCCPWWWILIGIAVAAIFFFILLLWKRKKKEEEQTA